MYILRHLTPLLGTRLALRSFNVHRLRSSINYVYGHLHQEPGLSFLDTQNVSCLKFNLSKSYTSQVSTNSKVVLERLKDRNIPQVKVALESADLKNHIFDLVSYYYESENKTGHEADERNRSIEDLYLKYMKGKPHYNYTLQVREHLSKSDSFKKLLETLPTHAENISIGDQLDIYMALFLLGVEETNVSMNHLFCNFHNTDCILGLSELTKISLILHQHKNSSFIFKSVYLTKLQKWLLENRIKDHEDCINLALILNCSKNLNATLVDACRKVLFYVAHSNQNDFYFILKVLNVLLTKPHIVGLIDTSNLLLNLENIIGQLEPQIKTLTKSKIVPFLSGFRPSTVKFFQVKYPRFFRVLFTQAIYSFNNVLSGDLPLEDKLDYLQTLASLYSVDKDLFRNKHINEMLNFISVRTPGASFTTLNSFVVVMQTFSSILSERYLYVFQHLIKEIIQILKSQSTFHVKIEDILISDCLNGLSDLIPFKFNELRPYTKWLLESGHVCSSSYFCQICKFAIPVLGNNMPSVADKRIRNLILLMHEDTSIYYLNSICQVLRGALFVNRFKHVTSSDSLIKLFTTTLQHQNLNKKSANFLMYRLIPYFRKSENSPTVLDLRKAVADKVVVDEYDLEMYNSLSKRPFISEKNANKLLKYGSLAYFDGKLKPSALLNVINVFHDMSRYPKDKQLLEYLSKSIFEKFFKTFTIYERFSLLQILCSLGIYLDQYLEIVFSKEHCVKFDEYVGKQVKQSAPMRAHNTYSLFKALNAEVVLHHQNLNIPWMSDYIVNLGCKSTHEHYLQMTVNFDTLRYYLENVLGESEFFKTGVKAEYGINIDFEFFLTSSNKPMNYKTAKQEHHPKSDIQKIAVVIGRKTHLEYLAEDPTDPSVYNTNMIRDLNALGYKAVLIQGHEWNSIPSYGRCNFLKRKIF